jgi:[protein-PII] uridylyltransferase
MESCSVARFDFHPITDESDVRAFLGRIPLAVDHEHFTRFVLGFPQRYLANTSPVEVVKHFALVSSLGRRAAISALAPAGELWKLVVVAGDRSFLFARIAGSLSFFGANILEAEAFANTAAVVLDAFLIADTGGRFRDPEERRKFQVFLEGVIEGRVDLDAALAATPAAARARETPLELAWVDDAHPQATLLRVGGRDSLGLLYQISRRLSEAGCNIEIAHVETPHGEVRDEFFLTAGGAKLGEADKARVGAVLAALVPPREGIVADGA